MSSILTAGIVAPNFTLRVTPDQMLTLSDLRGKPVILAFYPADWSPVCGDQVALYNELLSDFHKHNPEILGISVDGVWCHAAFARDRHSHFTLLADFEPKSAVAKKYGPTVIAKAFTNVRYSSLTARERSRGAIAHRLRSIPAQMAFSTLSNNSPTGQTHMADLKTPINKSDHIRGPAHAAISLVKYGDYQCPFCASACAVVDHLESYFEGQMRFVFRHFPLTEVHPYAEVAAESAEFAGTAGVFWEMHDALFRNQAILSVPTIMLIAEKLRLPETMMRHALETGQFRSKVRNDFIGGVRSGVNGTPTFFINGVRHEGPFDFASLASAIQSRLTADSHA